MAGFLRVCVRQKVKRGYFFTPVVEELWDSMQSYPPLQKGTVLILNFLNRFYLLFGGHFGSFGSAEVRKVHVSYSAEFGDQT